MNDAGESSSVSSGSEVYLTSSCSEPLADFALSPDGNLRHQYSGLCVAVNPAAASTTPPPPPPEGAAAVESASIGTLHCATYNFSAVSTYNDEQSVRACNHLRYPQPLLTLHTSQRASTQNSKSVRLKWCVVSMQHS